MSVWLDGTSCGRASVLSHCRARPPHRRAHPEGRDHPPIERTGKRGELVELYLAGLAQLGDRHVTTLVEVDGFL